MKLWFTRKTPKDVYDSKAPYDATVEQVLRAAQEVNAAPSESERDDFDFIAAFRATPAQDMKPEPDAPPPSPQPKPALPPATVSRAARDEMERRAANYRAFQMKLNDEREARIRRTMEAVRAQLKQSAEQHSSSH